MVNSRKSGRPLLTRSALIAGAVTSLVNVASLAAQEISGRVVQQETGEPVAAAIIELVDDSTQVVTGQTLTGPDGLFRLTGAKAGRYRLRVERIGLATINTAPFLVSGGSPVFREVVVPAEPISLTTLSVAAERRCSVRSDAPISVQRLWDEARKTLLSVSLLDEAWLATFRLLLWERDLDPATGRIRSEELSERTVMQALPFISGPPLELLQKGFIRREGSVTTYHVPDANVLLSEVFLETYCFHSTRDEERVGLAFEPFGGAAGIRGTLWLDRESGALSELEYAYTSAPDGGYDLSSGGVVEFDRIENGASIVSRWYVRMPRFAIMNGRETAQVALIRESGGQVQSSRLRGRPRNITAPNATVSGTLLSAEGEPLPDALVYVAGTNRSARTDQHGAFALSHMLPGQHVISWIRDGDRSGEFADVIDLEVSNADTVIVLRELPRLAYFSQQCGTEARRNSTGSVLGRVLANRMPVPFAIATAQEPGGRIVEVRTDAAGRFAFCDVREEALIEVTHGARVAVRHVGLSAGEVMRLSVALPSTDHSVSTDTVLTESIQARLAADSVAEVEARQSAALAHALERIPGSDAPGRVWGVVLSDDSNAPVPGARIVDMQSSSAVTTDQRGTFRFETRSPMLYLQVSHVGFATVYDTLYVPPGDVVQLEIRLGITTLEPIVVTTRRRGLLADAYWRRAHQTGIFLDTLAIRRRTPRVITDMLRDQSGVHVITQGSGVQGGRLYFRNECAPAVFVDGVEVTRVSSRRSDQAMREAFDEVNRLHPSGIELIEMYRGASELPGQFGGAGSMCGAIVIWSRRGN
ncbi:MAG TPA: carboxypeptidase regulatory-like domain-containing protein [Longimicrobiales bacterium]|nr:carboxypeptidase regulatory-like domain-containing protein [Longimicrobiales bacterium]